MARKTKAEREARVAAENAAQQAQQEAEWPARLMRNLERTSHHSMKLSVAEGHFCVVWLDRWNDYQEAHFKIAPTECADWDGMERLESALDAADRREEEYRRLEEESRRKQALRASALSKLTEDEREELGL